MDNEIEKIIELAGNKNKYQVLVLAITFMIWMCVDLIPISLAFLEKMPLVEYIDPNGEKVQTYLTYEICKKYTDSFSVVEPCGHSWVSEFNIECDDVKTGFIGTSSYIGVFIGAMTAKFFIDTIGRKKTIYISCILISLSFLLFLVPIKSIYYIYGCLILTQYFCLIASSTSYISCVEVVSIKYRSLAGAFINFAYCICGIVHILLYKYLQSWRINFLLASAITLTCSVMVIKFTRESARFYLIKNNPKRFIDNLYKISLHNGLETRFEKYVVNKYHEENGNEKNFEDKIKIINTLSSASDMKSEPLNFHKEDHYLSEINYDEIILMLKENSNKREKNEGTSKENKYNFLSLIKYKSQRYTFLIMNVMWFVVAALYYGLSLNIKNLPGDIYITGIFLYSVEGVSYIISGNLINNPYFGRKKSMIIFLSISLIIYTILVCIEIENTILVIFFALISRLTIAVVFNIIYTYSAEVYPSVVKSFGFNINNMFSRLSGIFVPLLIEILDKRIINYLFLSLNFLILILTFFLKETYGKPLTVMIPEQEITKDDTHTKDEPK